MSGKSGGRAVAPSRGGATLGPSTHSGGQPVKSSGSKPTRCPSTRSGSQPLMCTKGGPTESPPTDFGGQPVEPSRGYAAQEVCKGCSWTGKSLRGHLVRTKSPCKDLYKMEELKERAQEIHKRQNSQWQYDNREDRNERKRQQYNRTSGASTKKKVVEMSADPDKSSNTSEGSSVTSSPGNPKKEDLICNICEKTFVSSYTRDRHITEIHDPQPIPCPKCSKSFLRKDNLKDHLDWAHDIKEPGCSNNMQCKHCDKIFTQLPALQRHISEVHIQAKPFSCPECPQNFSRKENLRRHIELGQHTFTIHCEYCNQDLEFKSDTAMHKHQVRDPDHWDRKKKTCVEVLRWREHDPIYNSYTCDFCKERRPKSDEDHYILDPSTWSYQNVQSSCVNVLKKRDMITCLQCNEKFKFEDLRKHWPKGTKFNLQSTRWQAGSGMAHCINVVKKREEREKGSRRLGTLGH